MFRASQKLETTQRIEKMQKQFADLATVLYRPHENEIHLAVSGDRLLSLTDRLQRESFYPVTMVANDERELEDACFKIYFLFSHSNLDIFAIVEYALPPEETKYPSLRPIFPGISVFEREIGDMMGLFPTNPALSTTERGHWLHPNCYPADLFPLRRDRSTPLLQSAVYRYRQLSPAPMPEPPSPADGEWTLTVGPIHAATIEPGRFTFQLAGESVEDFSILLGYTHKGIERLFQIGYHLNDGWQLAERIVGDTAYAHSLAYCRAIERLAGVRVPVAAAIWRGVFLELERMTNHFNDCAGMAADVSLHTVANELLVAREKLLRLNKRLTGHRWLRGINRPGGVLLPKPPGESGVQDILRTVREAIAQCSTLGIQLVQKSGFRDRAIGIGVLLKEDAQKWSGGFVTRASGVHRDFRRQHPCGVYRSPQMQAIMEKYNLAEKDAAGDVFSRFYLRMVEAKASAEIISQLLTEMPTEAMNGAIFLTDIDYSAIQNFEFSMGYASGWRGDIIYWLMKDKFANIYRCKVCDPSTLNWQAMQVAIQNSARTGTPLSIADFPLVNKSFNLSYSGNDL